MNPYEFCPDDSVTVESLASELEELQGKFSMLMHYVSETHDATACENCGHVRPRKQMLAAYGVDVTRESSRWFCGFCLHAACMRGGNQPEVRQRIGKWLYSGAGARFLRSESGPATEYLKSQFAEEMRYAAMLAR